MHVAVGQINRALCIQIGVVGCRDDGYFAPLRLFPIGVSVVKKTDSVQTLQAYVLNIRDSIVGVESFFETQRAGSSVGAHKFQRQLGTKRDPMRQTKLPRPPVLRALIVAGKHADDNTVFVLCNGRELHAFVRTNPCAGAWRSSTLALNQGKQMGMPPRMA